jgi:hypothetical protein
LYALIEKYSNFNNIFELRNKRIKNEIKVLMISKFKLTVNLIALLSLNNWMKLLVQYFWNFKYEKIKVNVLIVDIRKTVNQIQNKTKLNKNWFKYFWSKTDINWNDFKLFIEN